MSAMRPKAEEPAVLTESCTYILLEVCISAFHFVATLTSIVSIAYTFLHGSCPQSQPISVSSDPASRQNWLQYFSPSAGRHKHGKCAHFFCSLMKAPGASALMSVAALRLPKGDNHPNEHK
jgi:hypothetical protein